MSDSLPWRLRETADVFGGLSIGGVHPQRLAWIRQAADELERLQEELQRVREERNDLKGPTGLRGDPS